MLTVKTVLKESSIQGLGVFADEYILKGTTIWKFNPRFDIVFDPTEVEKMDPQQKDFIHRYAYLSPETGKYVYSIDDSRFMNHSALKSNCDIVCFPGEPETRAVANRDIEQGEEILVDYRLFDMNDAVSNEEYLRT